ncbi:MAG: zinc-binding dehydrogenase [Gemmatimonadaceae bacterium]|nr:zinc-binding dehydrogenase [Gemmatimonadaceae bacterium]
MRAIRASKFGGPDVLELVTTTRPVPGPGQILVRVESASVNFADTLRRRNGPYPFPTALPFTPGSEVAGTVEALGDGVQGPPIGTPVFALAGSGPTMGSTGYAQFAVADAPTVAPIPPGMSADQACTILVAGLTALLSLTHAATLRSGETVVVQGAAGGVGAYAMRIAKALGAGRVIGAVGAASRRAAALAHGADDVVVYDSPTWVDDVRAKTKGLGADVILEMRGGDSLAQSLGALAPFGRVVVYGAASGETVRLPETTCFSTFQVPAPNHSIVVFNLGLWFAMRPQVAGAAIGQLLGLIGAGAVHVPVGRTMPLAQAADAHRLLEGHGADGKLILKPWA